MGEGGHQHIGWNRYTVFGREEFQKIVAWGEKSPKELHWADLDHENRERAGV